jgi:hypothetical protein
MSIDLDRLRNLGLEWDTEDWRAVFAAAKAVAEGPSAFYCRGHEESFVESDYPPGYDHRCDGCTDKRCKRVVLVPVEGGRDMSDLDRHLDVATRWLIRAAVEAWAEEGWENLADFGEHDYERICEAAVRMLPADVTGDEWSEAYEFFAGRSDHA